jgi:hypothetical protein
MSFVFGDVVKVGKACGMALRRGAGVAGICQAAVGVSRVGAVVLFEWVCFWRLSLSSSFRLVVRLMLRLGTGERGWILWGHDEILSSWSLISSSRQVTRYSLSHM